MLALGCLSYSIYFLTSEILNTYGFLEGESSSNLFSSRFLIRLIASVCYCYKVYFSFSGRALGESLDFRYSSRTACSFILWVSRICLIYSTLLVCYVGLGLCLSRVGSSRVRFTLSAWFCTTWELFFRLTGVCASLLPRADWCLFSLSSAVCFSAFSFFGLWAVCGIST